MRKFYRVAHVETRQGLWYDQQGYFTGLIHDKLNFCKNNQLQMEFDEELVGYLSATDSLEELYKWFSQDDIKQLQIHGYCIHVYEAVDVKYYEKFQHLVINQHTSKLIETFLLS